MIKLFYIYIPNQLAYQQYSKITAHWFESSVKPSSVPGRSPINFFLKFKILDCISSSMNLYFCVFLCFLIHYKIGSKILKYHKKRQVLWVFIAKQAENLLLLFQAKYIDYKALDTWIFGSVCITTQTFNIYPSQPIFIDNGNGQTGMKQV